MVGGYSDNERILKHHYVKESKQKYQRNGQNNKDYEPC